MYFLVYSLVDAHRDFDWYYSLMICTADLSLILQYKNIKWDTNIFFDRILNMTSNEKNKLQQFEPLNLANLFNQ